MKSDEQKVTRLPEGFRSTVDITACRNVAPLIEMITSERRIIYSEIKWHGVICLGVDLILKKKDIIIRPDLAKLGLLLK